MGHGKSEKLPTLLSTKDDGGVTGNNTYAYVSSFVP